MTINSEINSKPWYAVQTRSKCEKSSAAILASKGYEVFYPVRNTGSREQPLFPSYLFCRAASDSFGRIVTTPGIVRLLGRPGRPEAVPDVEIASVRRLVEAGLPVQSGEGITAGTRVRIRRGPLTGVEGDVIGTAEDARLAVSICLLQRFVSVSVELSWLERVVEEEMAYAVAS
jgi:transcription antitermination factor NusG